MGLLKDIWDIGKEISKPAVSGGIQRHASEKQKKAILSSFSKEFVGRDSETTSLLDYYTWHEHQNDWSQGSGRLLVTSHNEIFRLWAQPKLIAPYEAALVRYRANNGVVSRLFVLGSEYVDPNTRTLEVAVMLRHHLLNFSPRITSVIDLKRVIRNLEVDCEMFGSFNEQAAYFLRFPENSEPHFVRTSSRHFVNRAVTCHTELIKNSENFDSWYKRQPIKLTKPQIKEAELQCQLIHEISASHKEA